MIRHGRVSLLHRLADLILEQEIRGRWSFRRVRVAGFLNPLPLCTLSVLDMDRLSFTDPVRLGRDDRELWGRRHHLLHVQLRAHPHRWTGRERRPHWRHWLNDLESSWSKIMDYMGVLVVDFSTFSHSIGKGAEVIDEL